MTQRARRHRFGLDRAARRAGQLGGEGRPGRQGRRRSRATSSCASTASRSRARSDLPRIVGAHAARARKSTAQVWRKGRRASCTVMVARAAGGPRAAPASPAAARSRRPTAPADRLGIVADRAHRRAEEGAQGRTAACWSPTCRAAARKAGMRKGDVMLTAVQQGPGT